MPSSFWAEAVQEQEADDAIYHASFASSLTAAERNAAGARMNDRRSNYLWLQYVPEKYYSFEQQHSGIESWDEIRARIKLFPASYRSSLVERREMAERLEPHDDASRKEEQDVQLNQSKESPVTQSQNSVVDVNHRVSEGLGVRRRPAKQRTPDELASQQHLQ
ncbi:hypothetical protein T439DRAFT_351621 [Meredithblackwellia eburnea MCA 4105]